MVHHFKFVNLFLEQITLIASYLVLIHNINGPGKG